MIILNAVLIANNNCMIQVLLILVVCAILYKRCTSSSDWCAIAMCHPITELHLCSDPSVPAPHCSPSCGTLERAGRIFLGVVTVGHTRARKRSTATVCFAIEIRTLYCAATQI